MIRHRYLIFFLIPVLLVFSISACQATPDKDLNPTSIVEPPAVPTSAGPLTIEADQLLMRTRVAVEQGDRDFWALAGGSYYPALHPSYSSVDDFADQLDQITRAYDFQCQAVLRFPWLDPSAGGDRELLSILFSAAGNETYPESGVLTPEIGVFEVAFMIAEDGEIYQLQNAGFTSSTGETPEEQYQNLISYREERIDQTLQLEPCPPLE